MQTRLVVFDCDGVLVDSEPENNRLLAAQLTDLGLPTSTEQCYERYLGNSSTATLAAIERQLGHPVPSDFVASYKSAQRLAAANVVAVDGVDEVLDALEAMGMASCVASSGDHDKLAMALRASGLSARFEGRVFSASDVRHGKPAPDLFLHAAAVMGVQPSECVVVEDAPVGVMAARAARMRVIGYAGLTPRERLVEADAVIDRMIDAIPLLRS